MIDIDFRSAAAAVIALGAGFAASSALAQDAVTLPAGAHLVYVQPGAVAESDIVAPNAFGHFTCSFNEVHSHLERKNCGGTHYRYGY